MSDITGTNPDGSRAGFGHLLPGDAVGDQPLNGHLKPVRHVPVPDDLLPAVHSAVHEAALVGCTRAVGKRNARIAGDRYSTLPSQWPIQADHNRVPADSLPTAARSTMAPTLHMPWSVEGIVDDQ